MIQTCIYVCRGILLICPGVNCNLPQQRSLQVSDLMQYKAAKSYACTTNQKGNLLVQPSALRNSPLQSVERTL